MHEIDMNITEEEAEQLFAEAARITGISVHDIRVSCDPYGVPLSYLDSPIDGRLWRT